MKYILTKQEKAELRRKYLDNVRAINQYLPEDLKIRPDMKAFNRRLDDPKEQRFYKKGLELQKRENEKNQHATRLREKYENLLNDNSDHKKVDGLPRLCHCELATGDSPEVEAYNDAKIKNYALHPEAETQRRFQNLLKSDFSELEKISKSPDMDNLFLDYYEKNSAQVEDAFCLIGTLDHFKKTDITPEMQKYSRSIGRTFETLSTVNEKFRSLEKDYYFTMPELNEEQIDILNNTPAYFSEHRGLHDYMHKDITFKNIYSNSKREFVNLFEKGAENNVNFSQKGVLAKTVAIKPSNGENVALLDVTNGNYSANDKPVVTTLTEQEQAGVMKIFNKDYTKEKGFVDFGLPDKFKKSFGSRARDEMILNRAMSTNVAVSEVDAKGLGDMASSITGNWKERWLHTTSRQYKNFTKTMKDFETPGKRNYDNGRKVITDANAYLIHKGVRTREQAMALAQPGRDRALLCLDTMATFQKHLPEDEPRLIPGTNEYQRVEQPKKDWPAAIEDASLVNDDQVVEEEKVIDNEIHKENEIQAPEKDENIIS